MTVEPEIQASSIGNTFPPIKEEQNYDADNNRIKGFCTNSIESQEDLRRYVSDAEALRLFMKNRDKIEEVTRTTLRFVVNNKVKVPDEFVNRIEAVCPLDGNLSEYSIVYYGHNSESRMAPQDRIKLQQETAEKRDTDYSFEGHTSLRILRNRGVVIQSIKPPVEETKFLELVDQLVDLYKRTYEGDYAFPITRESVSALLRRDTNLVIAVRDINTKDIRSVAVGETAQIPLEVKGKSNILSIAEISDAATDPSEGNRTKGYYSAIICELTRELIKLGTNFVYSEARAQSEGVLRATRKSGLRLARNLEGRAALLHKHCIIGGARDPNLDERVANGEYNQFENLTVWSATRKQLMDLYT